MSKLTLLLLIFNFFIMKFISIKFAQIGLVLIFIKYFFDMGIFASTKFIEEIFSESEIFYWEYIGEYKKLHDHFRKLGNLITKYSLSKEKWHEFGFYYDDPKQVDPKKCRAVVGLQYELNENNQKLCEEVKDFLFAEDFKYKKIKQTKCLMAKYVNYNFLSIIFAIRKFYTTLEQRLKDSEFLKKYNLEDKQNIFKCTIEVYKKDILEFSVPLEHQQQFMLYSGKRD